MMHSPQSVSRRSFAKAMGVAGLATVASPRLLSANQVSKRLNLAFIGVGGRGRANWTEMTKDPDVRVVALCDVNQQNLEAAAKKFPEAKQFRDFRQLYEDAKGIDGFVVSTTEHTHAYATLPALQLGKPVYCEKPLTHNVYEARLITKAAAQAGVPTQMGTQVHAGSNYHRVVELIQSGAIGKVTKAHVWVSRAWGRQSEADAKANKDIVYVVERPKEVMTPPDFLDWDLWLGPAEKRPYHEVYFPGPKWYRWWDFGNGTMSDLGSHWADLPYWALKLDAPLSIESFGDPPHAEIAPASMTAVYEYGQRGDLPPCQLTWYQGTHKPKIWEEKGIPQWSNGVLFEGEKGMLLSDYGKYVLLPEESFKGFEPPEKFIPDSPGQQLEWLLACKTGVPTASPFSYAGPLTEANHLGNVAYRAGGKILWDTKSLRVTNNEKANRFLTRVPANGWKLG